MHKPLASSRRAALLAATLIAGLAPALDATAIPIAGRGTWETSLQPRDIDGNGSVDAWYDTALDLTWHADPNAAAGTAFDDGLNPVDGQLSWAGALTWTAGLQVASLGGWRLPAFMSGSMTESEISHLYYVTLGNYGSGNPATPTGPGTWGFTNTGPFAELLDDWVWLADAAPAMNTAWVWAGDPISAYHTAEPVTDGYLAWAVRSGDVAVTRAIPEPSAWALMLVGLGGLAAWSRRRR